RVTRVPWVPAKPGSGDQLAAGRIPDGYRPVRLSHGQARVVRMPGQCPAPASPTRKGDGLSRGRVPDLDLQADAGEVRTLRTPGEGIDDSPWGRKLEHLLAAGRVPDHDRLVWRNPALREDRAFAARTPGTETKVLRRKDRVLLLRIPDLDGSVI